MKSLSREEIIKIANQIANARFDKSGLEAGEWIMIRDAIVAGINRALSIQSGDAA